MMINEFYIGIEFFCSDRKWRCTDVGTRVIIAICISEHEDDPTWFNGPPYAVVESVFDENDQLGCSIELA